MTASVADAGRDMKIDLRAHLVPLQEQVTGGSRAALTLLLAAVGVVLLIVCVNLGNLMLVRAGERARDAAIRRALGASTGRLFRPILTESLLIALSGGALGVLLAYAGVRVSGEFGSHQHSAPGRSACQLCDAHIRFLCICRVRHSLRFIAGDPRNRRAAGGSSSIRLPHCHRRPLRQRSREWLVGLEVALSTVLLVVASLLGVSFFRVTNVERGYGWIAF